MKTFCAVILLLICHAFSENSFGIHLGANLSNEFDSSYKSVDEYRFGVVTGIDYIVPLHPSWNSGLSFSYSQRGGQKAILHYVNLTVPLAFQINLKQIQPYVGFAPRIDFLLNKNDVDGPALFRTKEDKEVSLAALAEHSEPSTADISLSSLQNDSTLVDDLIIFDTKPGRYSYYQDVVFGTDLMVGSFISIKRQKFKIEVRHSFDVMDSRQESYGYIDVGILFPTGGVTGQKDGFNQSTSLIIGILF